MSHVEYRVRAVTRFVVTCHRSEGREGSVSQIGEYAASELAGGVAAALALAEREGGTADAVFVPYEGPPPGKVMRCKVVMTDRRVHVASGVDAEGKYLGSTIQRGEGQYAHTVPDPTDPANWRPDGEFIRFGAVCAGFDKEGVANVEENRIFGYWSPSVNFDAVVRNEDVLRNLQLGGEYYVDFIPAPKPEAGA